MVALGAAICLLTSEQANAFCFRKKASSCPSEYSTSSCASPVTVTYVDQKVTAYKTEVETKDVKVTVNEFVDVKEAYKYFECVPVTSKRKITVQEQKTKEEPYTYTVLTPTTVKEKVKVCSMVPVTKDVEVTTYDVVRSVVKQKRVVCETICVPVTVTCTVPVAPPAAHHHGLFGGLCGKKHDDCAPPCPPEPCYQTITKTVIQRQVVSKEIEVDVPVCTTVPKKVIQKVTTYQTVWTEKEIDVTKCVPVEKTATRTVCFYVPVDKEIDVTTLTQVEKEGTRVVKKCVPVEKVIKQNFTKVVPYETTVKVAVYTPAPAPAAAPCETPCATPAAAPCNSCATTEYVSHGRRLGGCCHKSKCR
jgi:hypothetical protein